MAFVDPLAVMLIGLAMSTAIGSFYFLFAARGMYDQVKALIMPAIVIGLFDVASGFLMSFTWPMNASYALAYNMLFGDPLLLTGLVLVTAGLIGYKDAEHINWGVLPILIAFVGIYVLVGAGSMVQYNMESGSHFFPAFGLYVSTGIAALLTPILYLKPNTQMKKLLYYIPWIVFGIGTIFAIFLGCTAINGHLGSPP